MLLLDVGLIGQRVFIQPGQAFVTDNLSVHLVCRSVASIACLGVVELVVLACIVCITS